MDILAHIKASDANHCIATWYGTMIAVWWGPASLPDMANMADIGRALLRTQGPTGLLLIVEPTSPPPTGKILEEFSRFTRDVVSKMTFAVAVAEGGGFKAATMRSVAAALAMVLPQRLPYRFVDTVDQGAAAIAPHLPEAAGGLRGLVGAVDVLRKHTKTSAKR